MMFGRLLAILSTLDCFSLFLVVLSAVFVVLESCSVANLLLVESFTTYCILSFVFYTEAHFIFHSYHYGFVYRL